MYQEEVNIPEFKRTLPGNNVCSVANALPPGAEHISNTLSPYFKSSANTGKIEPPSIK